MSTLFSLIDELTSNMSLKSHYASLSHRYRFGQDKTLQSNEENLAYIACRMPATYAACCEVFKRLKEVVPHFEPKSMLDVGSGPATAVLALAEHVKTPDIVTMVEPDQAFVALAKKFITLVDSSCAWQERLPQTGAFDLVTSSYMLSELEPSTRDEMIKDLMRLCSSCIVLIDTGTPHGYETLMQARDVLIEQQYTILAPCPHNKPVRLLHLTGVIFRCAWQGAACIAS